MERSGKITMKGNPVTLIGPTLEEGQKAPDFTLLDNSLNEVKLSDTSGKVRLFSVVPSLDTGVCSTQTQKFNKEANELPDDVEMYTISADLPFAQARFCSENGIDRMKTLSDHRDVDFGSGYGLLIKELRLLARAVIVVDQDDTIRHFQIVPEVTDEPDYQKALDALKQTA